MLYITVMFTVHIHTYTHITCNHYYSLLLSFIIALLLLFWGPVLAGLIGLYCSYNACDFNQEERFCL